MQVVVEELGFKLVPHREGLCYELFEWKSERVASKGRYIGCTVPEGWVRTGQYPTSVPQGLHAMLERATNADPAVVRSVSEAATRMEDAAAAILAGGWSEQLAVDPGALGNK